MEVWDLGRTMIYVGLVAALSAFAWVAVLAAETPDGVYFSLTRNETGLAVRIEGSGASGEVVDGYVAISYSGKTYRFPAEALEVGKEYMLGEDGSLWDGEALAGRVEAALWVGALGVILAGAGYIVDRLAFP